MRFATLQTAAGPRAALLQGEHYVDFHATDPSLPLGLRQLLERGPAGFEAARQAARQPGAVKVAAASAKLLPPIPDPPKIVCLGLNYRDHAAESGAPIPKEPVLFSKYATSLIGPGDAIVLPPV